MRLCEPILKNKCLVTELSHNFCCRLADQFVEEVGFIPTLKTWNDFSQKQHINL
jgi:hypothetical protein